MPAATPHNAIPATLIPGDGIGLEITEAVVKILAALGVPFAWDVQEGGNAAVDYVGKTAEASRLRTAIDQTLVVDNVRTGDLGGKATAYAITGAILRRLA